MAPLSSSYPSSFISSITRCDSQSLFSISSTSLEVKPRLDLWSENSSAWSLSSTTTTDTIKARQTKGVRFSSRRNETFEIIHLSEYSKEEKNNCWYSKQEKESMKESRRTCQRCLEENQDLAPANECLDGLETPRESYFSMQRIRQAIHAVLAEQHDQRMFGLMDPDYLAMRYTTAYTTIASSSSSCKQSSLPNHQNSLLDSASNCFRVAAMA
eukprot:scaffold120_cov59-Cylindrotheca_fusiformis.AAC.11